MSRFRLPEGGRDGARERLRLPGGRTLFLTVRNLAPRMGLETFVEAFAGSALLRERAMGVIGGRGLLEESLWALVRDGGLEDCIRFWGFVDEEQLPDLYGAADWFVLPTRLLEGFGLVIPEAWACGTPVLGTPQGAIPDILSAVDPNHVFDGLDAQALRRKMEDVVRRPQEYRHDPQALREHAAGRFAWSMVAGAFEEVVRGAVEGGPLRSGG
nr:glycosyltransferase [Desulfobaculum xiamenense]